MVGSSTHVMYFCEKIKIRRGPKIEWVHIFQTVCFSNSFSIKGALTLKINKAYFENNISDDGSYTFDASDSIYTKTISATNLAFSMDDDCKYH